MTESSEAAVETLARAFWDMDRDGDRCGSAFDIEDPCHKHRRWYSERAAEFLSHDWLADHDIVIYTGAYNEGYEAGWNNARDACAQ